MSVQSTLDDHVRYLTWIFLTDGGRLTREQLSPLQQEQYDAAGLRPIMPVPVPMTEPQQQEAKRLYLEACAEIDRG
jgi:hypothetical protein